LTQVQLIFRKANPQFFSIEKVFGSIFNCLQKEISVQKIYVPYYSISLINMAGNLFYARKLRAEIYHVTGDVHYIVLALPANKTILTIHDSVFLRESSGLKRIFFKWIFLKLPVKRCRLVTTISEKSKEEILRFTGCSPEKIVVIPNPVDQQIYYKEKNFDAGNPRLLFIGSTPNKNLDLVIQALDGIPCILDIVGRISEDQHLLFKKHNVRFRQYTGLSDSEIADRYAACDMLVFASLYEGFGLPILEAQKAGRPVLTSNISPMKEVAGEGACLVDPEDPESVRGGIIRIIGDSHYREELVKKGFENVSRYQTHAIANRYVQLYKSLVGSQSCAE
jgi:glycosyltransferase involved in cell wall biosynthesis